MRAESTHASIADMFDESSSSGPKVPLNDSSAEAVQRLGRWMRVVGTIQMALSGFALLILGLSVGCGMLAAGPMGAGFAMIVSLIPVALAAVFLLQGLRIQAAGEQFKNLADEHDVDYLELAFVRLKTVYIVDIIIGALSAIGTLGGAQ